MKRIVVLAGFWLCMFSAVTEACPLCKEILTDPSQLASKLSLA